MAAIATISQTISRGKLSIGYAANNNAKGDLFSRRLAAPGSPVAIAMVTDALEWSTEGYYTDAEQREISNYLFWLIGMYGQQAAVTLGQTSGGGSLTAGATAASPLDWVVGATASSLAPLKNGDTTVTLDGTNGMPNLRDYNIEFTRNNAVQNTTDPGDGSTYYSWNRITGVFALLNGAAYTGERLRILPT